MVKLKILHVNNYDFTKGGSDKYFIELINALNQKSEIKVRSFAPLSKQVSQDNLNLNKKILIKDTKRVSTSLIFNFKSLFYFWKTVKKFKPDIIHLHIYYGQLTSSILIPLLFKRNIKIVQTLHEYKLICPIQSTLNNGSYCDECKLGFYTPVLYQSCNPKGKIHSIALYIETTLDFILRKLLKNKIKLLSVSSYQKKILLGRGVQSEVLKTVPLFSSFPIAKKIVPVKNKKSLNIIFVGRLEAQKGIYDLIEFIKRSPFIATLKIVGDGEEKNKIENLIKKDRILSKKVKLYGSIFNKGLIKLIDISDIFINPSQYLETFGLVNIEAMSRGKIVLSSKTGALGEVIKDGVNGFLFDPKIKKSIDESLNKIIANPNLFQIQKNSIETAKKNSIENHVEKILTYYNSVLSK